MATISASCHPSLVQSAIVAAALKVLLYPAYKSTDFEVHRNWLAITYSLPIKEWYFENTSEWTLDYPPFFAYFEWIMARLAQFIDPVMLQVQSLNHQSWETIAFQRSTVIASEMFLLYALYKFVQLSPNKSQSQAGALAVLLSPGLLIIDHIHFQYNGFMYGILLLSLAYSQHKSTLLISGSLFAILLCFKHIYLYLAPAYFVYLLSAHCLTRTRSFPYIWPKFTNAMTLALSIITIFGSCFGPFVLWNQLPQVLSRLFPFSRGLTHAYWAPNVWALYSFADRILLFVHPHIPSSLQSYIPIADASALTSGTRGLVGDSAFTILPAISPRTTFILTLAAQLPGLTYLFLRPTAQRFLAAITLSGYASFLFGWHVHEKAVLLILLPYSLLAPRDRRLLAAYVPLAVAGHVSLFPLLFGRAEWPVKILYTAVWSTVFAAVGDGVAGRSTGRRLWLLDRFNLLYVLGALGVVAYVSFVHDLLFRNNFEFVPLMMVSVYTAIGVVSSWVGFVVVYFDSSW